MLSGLYSLVKDWLHSPGGRQAGLAGADVRTVAELLRDRTLHMVMTYSHLAPDFTLEAVQRCKRNSRFQATPQ